ncbi:MULTISPECIES: helicase C-terminal domain-containing protein [Streptomyces]|uniref:Helicase C-terminal domain-containing protein n=1 Tax=Streptomyces caniscabiei TaxID=2746961 RepID=A0ABU4MUL6_9ACTN|nr:MULTISPECIES: helicase C-terminal domain-containing protein [Streptomyces]MBE4738215.1 helicase-associated domain-containing protein [Streptomyces caniscabiei]MBE4756977.1 helicase-associated domain-containing protein [Streptomyces caniscabiei]MBE4773917.1 helicase-associated domain-containing protein [Streptomyces caniscabiei]MBE4785513.1 helicase-associated domain-containing protein [Streptomyces caniscabiei]MBE4796855.1 helicase-associated domain-containing protein [Streptomyces caniscab
MSTEEQFPTEAAPAGGAPRSLAEALRGRDDRSLAVLLRARPDLITPVPTDLTQLATRAGTRASVVRALERLDRFALQTAQALAVAADPASYDELASLLAGDDADPAVTAALPHALGALRDQALVWGPEHRLRLVRTARELLAPSPQHPSPTGLGPTVAEATAGMSPGRVQEIVAAVGLASTHDSVSAVTSLAALFTDRRRMAALLATAPAESLDVLTRLVWGPPYGQVTANPAPHLRWLLDRGLLLPTAPGTVVIPREVALHLRSGRAHRDVQPVPPPVEASGTHRPQVVDATAAGQAYTALATVEELLKDWDEGGPGVLRAGGLSVRDLKRTAVALDLPEPVAAFWVELAYAAGLLASDGEADERYAATPAYDEWLELPPADRWTRLATAWLTATRTPGVIGERDAKDRTLSALGPGLDRSAAPEVRHRVLALLAALPEGTSATPDSVLARLHWERPTRGGQHPHQAPAQSSPAQQPPQSQASQAAPASPASQQPAARSRQGEDLRARIARWTLSEAESLGITGRGALSSHGRALLGLPDGAHAPAELPETPGDKLPAHHVPLPHPPASAPAPDAVAERAAAAARAARLLAPLLPEPLDHVLLQADLTAVAPGPLKRPLADMLGVLADVESKGGATVYRFTPGSVRRALDAGRSASDLHDFLTAHSRTPVPQPLAYLIDDVARRHGHLRIGAASAYVRCDDDAMLSEILADKRSQGLGLRRLAPTVLAAQTDPAALLDGLRAMGYAPAAESAEGDVLITRAHARRTPPRTAPEPVPDGPPAPDDTLLGAAIRAIRAGDLASTTPRRPSGGPAAAPGALPRTGSAETLATMQAAVLTGEALWIGYVNAEGSASQRVIAPVRVEGGFVTAYDHTADEVRTFPLHRITGVAELADDST